MGNQYTCEMYHFSSELALVLAFPLQEEVSAGCINPQILLPIEIAINRLNFWLSNRADMTAEGEWLHTSHIKLSIYELALY